MTTTAVPTWSIQGDWFDVCSCNIACPCEFAQPPTGNQCNAVLAYRINSGHFGDVDMGDLNVLVIFRFTGDLWGGAASDVTCGLLIDDRATEVQMNAIGAIWGGAAGGWPGAFAQNIGDFRGVEVVPMRIDVAEDLGSWSVEVPGRITASAVALTGPTADPTRRVQLHNPPGSEVGPGAGVATWAVGQITQSDEPLFGDFHLGMVKTSSKHIPFAWSGGGDS
ncbi:MAG: DUF1326 domain-containing protein [Sporichthyaceae bacterium]